jgi:hypothetical protein
MASSGTLPAGTSVYSSTLAAATADTVTFPDRYGYLTVTNTGTTVLYVRSDGTAATVAGNDCLAVVPGESEMVANAEPLWYQSSKVILAGVNQFGGGNTAANPGAPGMIQSQTSLAGHATNPGTSISLISAGTPSYTVAAAG